GYAAPAFWVFSYSCAAPVALALSIVVVWLARGVLRRGRKGAESLTDRLGIAGSLATAVPVVFAYAEYAAGRVLGQYLIPIGYFAAVVASAVVFQRLLGSKRLLIVAVAALFVFSVVSLGTNSPDWAPLEHT